VPTSSGPTLFQTYSNGGIKMWAGGKLVMDHWRQGWLPWKEIARANLVAGKRTPIKVEWDRSQGGATELHLAWKPGPHDDATSLWSEVGDGVDYTFVYGPRLDRVIAGYRQLTGAAKMLPKWAFGLWQSRQRYETQQQSVDVVDGFRKRHIPFDNIVQDWFYWKPDGWGSHQFDPSRFPDPQGWIEAIHARNAHLMISVWGKFYPTTDNFAAMNAKGYLYQPNLTQNLHDWVNHPYTFYDAFNPGARQLFWDEVRDRLFDKHVDAWWMDATEPDLLPQPTLEGTKVNMNPTALGPASRILNGYALFNSQGIFEGQRAAAPDQRVFILTRSGFAGLQRYSTASWSGDISSTWTAMKKQIAAGLSYCISGLPYWTMDTGGFSVPPRYAGRNPKPQDVDEWRELNARWFEFATFTPMLRVHGEFPYREMWELGGEQSPAYKTELKFDKLRYSLLPYIYSLAGDVAQRGGTMMRPLGMDFPNDATARRLTDEYMFGPAFLVAPVTEYLARSRGVYLPKVNGGWFDYWTNKRFAGGGWIEAAAPLDAMPLFVRAGSIVPHGPNVEFAMQKTDAMLRLDIYPGADGQLSLFEDDGLTNGYERGQWSRTPIIWQDREKRFSVGARQGAFKGMPRTRDLHVGPVYDSSERTMLRTTSAIIRYEGDAVSFKLK
jgi:alpha-D-xyloside xylohydrolase